MTLRLSWFGVAVGWLLLFAIAKNAIPEKCPTCEHPIAGKWNCREEGE